MDNRIVIYSGLKAGANFQWVLYAQKPLWPFSTLVLDREQKTDLKDIMSYLHLTTRSWYRERGIPYRRVYLFSGPPGTGNTSLVLAIATRLRLNVYLLNMEGLTVEGIIDLVGRLPSTCLLLVEDIDCVSIYQARSDPPSAQKREKDNGSCTRKNSLSLSALLNVIDGVAASEGRILIMTTNHSQNLDQALTRPGRIDKTIHFRYADRAMIQALFYSIYRASDDSESNSVINKTTKNDKTTAIAMMFASRVPENTFTAAETQGYLL